ncbi:MAG: ATP-binding region ATPase domain protein [Modestobacter sp.]|nr:ATP-binding region ATPase domain protein [Modestobacter sp.]
MVAARRVVREVLSAWGGPQDHQDAELLVTELVANVVDHVDGDASLGLEVALSDGWLRIAVADSSAIRPVVRELSGESTRGRGLQLVAAIAERWGVEGPRRRQAGLVRPGPGRPLTAGSLPSARGGDGSGDRDRRTKESSR